MKIKKLFLKYSVVLLTKIGIYAEKFVMEQFSSFFLGKSCLF